MLLDRCYLEFRQATIASQESNKKVVEKGKRSHVSHIRFFQSYHGIITTHLHMCLPTRTTTHHLRSNAFIFDRFGRFILFPTYYLEALWCFVLFSFRQIPYHPPTRKSLVNNHSIRFSLVRSFARSFPGTSACLFRRPLAIDFSRGVSIGSGS